MSKFKKTYSEAARLRGYSSIFSSTSFSKLLKNDDYSFLTAKIERYDIDKIGDKFTTYHDYIKYVYKQLLKGYRNEYLYKNTLIEYLLKKNYGADETVVFNEFKVGKSVADLAFFNGISKVFEIKTELDSEKRLESQLADYCKLFQKCYIVTFETLVEKYLSINDFVGIIAVKISKEKLKIEEVREAQDNNEIDPLVLMRSLRTQEYKNIVSSYYHELPKMNSFDMFTKCQQLIAEIPYKTLNDLFILQMKKRHTNTTFLSSSFMELRQLCLSININSSQYDELNLKLNQPINI